jgi:hypothetical protein
MSTAYLQTLHIFSIIPDEAWCLEFGDVTIVDDENLGKTILEIEVRGKRGVGYCESIPGAVRPFERLRSRLRPARIYGANTLTKPNTRFPASNTVWHPWRDPKASTA